MIIESWITPNPCDQPRGQRGASQGSLLTGPRSDVDSSCGTEGIKKDCVLREALVLDSLPLVVEMRFLPYVMQKMMVASCRDITRAVLLRDQCATIMIGR